MSLSEPLLDVAAVAELLGVNHRTIRTLIHQGQLRAVRIGVQIRIEPAALRAYLDANTVQVEAEEMAS